MHVYFYRCYDVLGVARMVKVRAKSESDAFAALLKWMEAWNASAPFGEHRAFQWDNTQCELLSVQNDDDSPRVELDLGD